ncbi:uncharacterized protein PADG_06470 [Paracoccidioides brasiliensis Pb18]|uniref:Haloacid dehalogenase, type II n=1 Tax=Paracoccidioides brasiliensis (strain Pb18) TaxID=502780 RepID=C1GGN3_PARBD|nr:uncharacterized protein PADG_06470 [Paracoccidioides brasiliensis Pb18]EEH50391.1 hypothetical protein PADG_06470 [Paracoccidioides brasiliensis Pb18]
MTLCPCPRPSAHPRTLLLTLDAFNTLFQPRLPVPVQYAQVAQSLSFPPPQQLTSNNKNLSTEALAEKISVAFRAAFKRESAARPNYGRNVVGFGGPREWWGNVVRGCFRGVVRGHADGEGDEVEVPEELVRRLLVRFEGREGYVLYPDVEGFFERLTRWKASLLVADGGRRDGIVNAHSPFERVVVGVISNSDDRIASILHSLGVRVGETREEHITTAAATETGLRRKIPADIDFIVTSYEADAEKPHRKIFDMAKERAKECLDGGGDSGLSPSGDPEWICVHVGDHYEKDYEGAINAGWDSFLLPRDGEGPSVSDYRLDSSSTVKHIRALTDLFPRLGMDKRLLPVERMM